MVQPKKPNQPTNQLNTTNKKTKTKTKLENPRRYKTVPYKDFPHNSNISIYLSVSLILLIKKKILIYLYLAALGLHCCTQPFSSCGDQGLLCSCDF